jgi:hypothetical protein
MYAGNQYAPSNEHDLQAPYVYDYIGQPWKTQRIMRGFQALYRPTPDGLPGNDDLGSMSAWFVWSALGFFPEAPGAPVYVTGSPMFEKASIRPAGGDEITVEAPGASIVSKYIQSARLGDSALDRPWFTHDQLLDAGSVRFEMGLQPDESWGAAPNAAPPSMSTSALSAFGCPERIAEDPEPAATRLIYVGETRVKGDSIALAARLEDATGAPLQGLTVAFEIAGRTVTAVTDADGVARTTTSVPDHGKSQVLVARFAGTGDLLPSQTSATLTWGNGKG